MLWFSKEVKNLLMRKNCCNSFMISVLFTLVHIYPCRSKCSKQKLQLFYHHEQWNFRFDALFHPSSKWYIVAKTMSNSNYWLLCNVIYFGLVKVKQEAALRKQLITSALKNCSLFSEKLLGKHWQQETV